ncbi:hypothetical protein NUW58_g6045 [Xylaria curta]|uniref:Uncharacterized protein n=1 Tax=Xylaria curta TaxID=42375 RepID=A0ACC1NYN7_9PEZI|nr:hypothetical protein NUW58_g6045 [Xylaria curta]
MAAILSPIAMNKDKPLDTVFDNGATPRCHPLVDEVSREVEFYFLQHWNFPDEKARASFLKTGYGQFTCFYYPLARNDRIHISCRFITLLILNDDLLDGMSIEDGAVHQEKLLAIVRGDVAPDSNAPAEYIIYDVFERLRACDRELADEIMEPLAELLRAQTDKVRLTLSELEPYLEYREIDIAGPFLAAVMRFATGLRLIPAELELVKPLERNASRQLLVANDICSYEKEVRAVEKSNTEGAALCNVMQIFANNTLLSIDSTRRMLWHMMREWEEEYLALVDKIESAGCREVVKTFLVNLRCLTVSIGMESQVLMPVYRPVVATAFIYTLKTMLVEPRLSLLFVA